MKKLKLNNQDLGNLCQALSHLYHAGMLAGDAFSLLAEEEQHRGYRQLFEHMAARCDAGWPLSKTFREAGCFPAYLCNLLEAGEKTGKTEETLTALADYYTRRAQLDRRLYSMLLYPAVLLLVLLLVLVILLIWVLPVFQDVYALLGSSLTGLAGGLMAVSHWLTRAMPGICVFLGAVLLLGIVLFAVPALRRRCADLLRRVRGDRGLWRRLDTARFAQGLYLGLSGGLSPYEAGALAVSLTHPTSAFAKKTDAFLKALEQGCTIAEALRQAKLLAAAHCRLLEAGQRSGTEETVLYQISQNLSLECDQAAEDALGRIEPTLVIVLCALVGMILLSVMLPLMNIMNAIG